MVKFLFAWIIIGVVIAIYKINQSRKFGFKRKVEINTLPILLIGILVWPVILIYIFNERKTHKEASRKAMMEKSELGEFLDDWEKELEQDEKD